MAEERKFRFIGTRAIRPDGLDKVTGQARYGADIHLPGMIYGKVLRSPHAHARILSIDTSRAERVPGVMAAATAEDFADDGHGSRNLLAKDKVLYEGHAIAAIAATSPHVAQEALKEIEVRYELLDPVMDLFAAMREDAPLLHPEMRTSGLGEGADKPSNVASHMRIEHGDVEAGFADADVVVEREFRTSPIHQGYLEPQSAVASVDPTGKIKLWCSTQGHFDVPSQVARLLGVPSSTITVELMEVGGAFGGKNSVYLEPVAVILARKSGRPVKMTLSYEEVLKATGPTSGSHIRVKMGATRDGTLTAAQAYLAYEAGAYPGSPVGAGAACMFAPYRLENVLVDGYDVVCNRTRTSALRAPGVTNAAYGSETVIDELADAIGMDPLQFRMKNGAKTGDRRADGPVFPEIGFLETLQAAMECDHWKTPLTGENRGRGVAAGFWFNFAGPASVCLNVHADGTVTLVEGSPDLSGTRGAFVLVVAEVLGLDPEDVRVVIADTKSLGYTGGSGGSSATFKTSWVTHEAAQDVKKQAMERAAMLWEVPPGDVVYREDGTLTCTSDDEKRSSFKEIAAQMNATGGTIVGQVSKSVSGNAPSFAVHIADVEVDPETGKVDVVRYTAVQDVGRAMHRDAVEGQMHGGVGAGIGWALSEEYVYAEDGRLLNPSLLDYRMPTTLDVPLVETVIVEVPNPNHPYGMRGVAEVAIAPPCGAIANAVYDAVGVRMEHLPMSPPRVLEALWKAAP